MGVANTNLNDEQALKDAVKSAIVELIQERPNLIRELLEEIVEDLAFGRAIQEGVDSTLVDRSEVFELLESSN